MIPAGQQGGSAGTGPGCTPSGCLGCSFAHHSQCWLDGRARACHGVRQMGQQQFASLEELTAGCERVAEPGTSAHKCAWVCACLVHTQRGVQSMSSYSAATCGQHLQPLALAPALANQSSVQGKGVGHKDLNKPTLSLLSLTLSHQTPHPMIHACLGPGQVGQDPCPSLLFQL